MKTFSMFGAISARHLQYIRNGKIVKLQLFSQTWEKEDIATFINSKKTLKYAQIIEYIAITEMEVKYIA